MTTKEFKRIQKKLGLNNPEMAKALGIGYRLVEEIRGNRRRVTPRTALMVEMLLRAKRRKR
jgi:plasmid maintenance system antidote protein VapI